MRLQISANQQHHTTGIDVKDVLLIGRADLQNKIKPDLDLSPYGGEVGGVSRQHARIISVDNLLFLEDLDSTNGTRLNGFQLKSFYRYRLRDGDEIQIGMLRMMIRFVKAPLTED